MLGASYICQEALGGEVFFHNDKQFKDAGHCYSQVLFADSRPIFRPPGRDGTEAYWVVSTASLPFYICTQVISS